MKNLFFLALSAGFLFSCESGTSFHAGQPASQGISTFGDSRSDDLTQSSENSSPFENLDQNEFTTEEFSIEHEVTQDKVDIVFMVDSSGSMLQEVTKLKNNLPNFVNTFLKDHKTVDAQIFIVAKQIVGEGGGSSFSFAIPDLDFSELDHEKIVKLNGSIGSKNSLTIFEDFVDQKYNHKFDKNLFFRLDSNKHVVFISDDDSAGYRERSGSFQVSQFERFVDQNQYLADKTTVHAIVGLNSSVKSEACNVKVGQTYIDLANSSLLGQGVVQDLCKDDWSVLLKKIADSIITNSVLINEYQLRSKVRNSSEVEVSVNNKLINQSDFEIIDQVIKLNPSLNVSRGDGVTIKYFDSE